MHQSSVAHTGHLAVCKNFSRIHFTVLYISLIFFPFSVVGELVLTFHLFSKVHVFP